MDNRDAEQNMEDSYNQEKSSENISPLKGGLRTMPFIIVNESFERVASYGLMPNMILYMMKGYYLNTATATTFLALWSALSNFLAVIGAFISDSYFGRFRVIAMGSVISLFGMILLWLTTMIPEAKPPPCDSTDICKSPSAAQLSLLLSALGFMSIGAGCIRPCSIAFGADQWVKKGDAQKDKRILESYFNWYYASIGVSTMLALTVIVYITENLGWKIGFGVPVILMFLSAGFFLVGSSLYVKVKANTSLFGELAQVLVAAWKNRHLTLPLDGSDEYYCHGKDPKFVTPSENLRFLNNACIIREPEEILNPDGSVSKPWELCTVDQVEDLKSLIRVIPIWSTGIMIYVTLSQTITVIQAKTMNRHITSNFQIPAASFNLFTVLTVTLWVALYDRLIVPLMNKYTRLPHGITHTQRMGLGLMISCIGMAVAAIVETIRRRLAIEEGLSDEPTAVIHMSAMWLVPQFCLGGLAETLSAVGQIEFYFSQLPKSMSSMAMAIFTLGTAFAGLLGSLIVTVVNEVTKSGGRVSWLSSNPNKGHYDYYYWLLTFLSVLNFVYFLLCCRAYGPYEEGRAKVSEGDDDLKEGLLSKSSEFPTTSSA